MASKATLDSLKLKNLETRKDILKGGKGYFVIPVAVMADPELSTYEKLVYGYLLSCVRPGGFGMCNPSDLDIKANCGISVRQVRRARSKLRERAWISWERTDESNQYRLFSPSEHQHV